MKALAFLVIALAVACVYALPTNNEQAELAPAMIAKNEGSSESLSLAQEALQLAQHSVNFRKKLKKLLKEGVPTADQIKALINDEVALSTETIHYELRQERNHLVKEVKDGIELLSEGLAFELAAYKDQPMPDEVKAKIAIIEDNIGKLKDRLAVHEADAASSTGVAEEATPAVDTVTAEEVASLATEASTAEQLLGGTAPVDASTAEAAIADASAPVTEEEESSSTAEATEEPSSSTADAAAPTEEEEESSSTAEATEEPSSSTADAATPTEEVEESSTAEATEEPSSSTADAATPTEEVEESSSTADESSSTGEEATDDSSSTGVDGESSSSGADASASH